MVQDILGQGLQPRPNRVHECGGGRGVVRHPVRKKRQRARLRLFQQDHGNGGEGRDGAHAAEGRLDRVRIVAADKYSLGGFGVFRECVDVRVGRDRMARCSDGFG